jgi:hypothetical protein
MSQVALSRVALPRGMAALQGHGAGCATGAAESLQP